MHAPRLPLIAILVSITGGCLPSRDNGSDPTVRPQARAAAYVLVAVDGPAQANVIVQGAPYRAVLTTEEKGRADSYFLVDARGTSDPNSPASALDFAFDLGATGSFAPAASGMDLCPGAALGSPGASGACLILEPSRILAIVDSSGAPVRNGPIPVVVRVKDEGGHADEATVELRVDDIAPLAAAGADYVLPLKTCAPGPGCTYDVFLDGSASSDGDPVLGDAAGALRAYCWEEVAPSDGSCLGASAFTVVDASPVPECPANVPASCSHFGRALRATVGAALVGGEPPHQHFQLHVKDRYGWSDPKPLDVRIEQTPLWFLRATPAVAYRASGNYYRIAPEQFLGDVGLPLDRALRPTVAAGPNGNFAIFLLGEEQNSWYANRFDRSGVSFFARDYSNYGYTLRPELAANDAQGLLWAALLPVSDLTLHPDNTFMVATSGGGATLGVGECQYAPAFCTIGRLSFLVVAPDRTALAALRGGTELIRFALDGIGGITVTRTPGFAGISGLDVAPDGRIFVSDLSPSSPSTAAVRIFAPDGIEEAPVAGIGRVDALRYDEATDSLWVNAADTGVWVVPLASPQSRDRVSEAVGEAATIRVTSDRLAWVAARGTNEVWRIDPALSALPSPILSDGINSGASGILFDGAPLMSFRTNDAAAGALLRMPPLGLTSGGSNPPLGAFRDGTADADRGGLWQLFSDPPQVVQSGSDGVPFAATSFSALDIGGVNRPLLSPWRVAADPVTRALWILDGDPTDYTVETRWLLADRAVPGTPAAPTGVAFDTRSDEVVRRLRPAGGATNAAAWAFFETLLGGSVKIAYVKRSGTGFTRVETFAYFPAGPAVAQNGTAWFAKCQDPIAGALNINSVCTCIDASDATNQCHLGTKLGFAPAGASAVTPFVPPGIDLGNCSGGLCSVVPLDVAYDTVRNALWVAAVDHGDAGSPNIFRFWRFSCSTGGLLQTCTAGNIVTATRPVGFLLNDPLQTSFDMEDANALKLFRETPDLLGIDPGTGDAFFLEPISHIVDILSVDTSVVPPQIHRTGFFRTDGMTRTAIGR